MSSLTHYQNTFQKLNVKHVRAVEKRKHASCKHPLILSVFFSALLSNVKMNTPYRAYQALDGDDDHLDVNRMKVSMFAF